MYEQAYIISNGGERVIKLRKQIKQAIVVRPEATFNQTTCAILRQSEGNTLIVSDTCTLTKETNRCLNEAAKQLRYEDWDVVYLGAEIQQRLYYTFPNLLRLRFALGCHAIIYNERFIPTMVHLLEKTGNSFEKIMMYHIQPLYRVYLLSPMVAMCNEKEIEKIYNHVQRITKD